MIESIEFVVPSYRTGDTLPEVVSRIGSVAPRIARRHTVVVIDDACPEQSGMTVVDRKDVRVYRFDSNQGQRTAVLAGLALVDAEIACVMDADLQDDPDSVIDLVERLLESSTSVMCAGRRGDHESLMRRAQAFGFRRLRWLASGGRIPPDAGLFHVARRAAFTAMVGRARPGDDPLVAYARSGAQIASTPVERRRRARGRSSYTIARRARMAVDSVSGLLRDKVSEPLPEPRIVDRSERS